MAEITPNDIVNKEFRQALRGYVTDQVDEYLQLISESQFRLIEENKRLQAQAEELRSRLKQYEQTEDLIKNALVLAERTAEETRQHAHQEADLIRREAEATLTEERAALIEIHQSRSRLIAELRALLYAHLAMLEDQEKKQTS